MTRRGTGTVRLAESAPASAIPGFRRARPSAAQRRWLARGVDQPGGKLPLFDEDGQAVNPQTIQSCIRQGWAAPWIRNPIKPDWLVCKLTDAGRAALDGEITD